MGQVKAKKTEKEPRPDPLLRWRFEKLLALGFAPDEAMPLVETPDIVNAASKLVERGCPPHLAASLLEE